jgi:hypothetical protein
MRACANSSRGEQRVGCTGLSWAAANGTAPLFPPPDARTASRLTVSPWLLVSLRRSSSYAMMRSR